MQQILFCFKVLATRDTQYLGCTPCYRNRDKLGLMGHNSLACTLYLCAIQPKKVFWKSNGTVTFWKMRLEITSRGSPLFSIQNGTAEIYSPFDKFSSFQAFISLMGNRIINCKFHLVWLVCWFWKKKTLTVIQRFSQLVYFDRWLTHWFWRIRAVW